MKITSYLPLMLVPLVAACAPPPPTATVACTSPGQITITPSNAAVTAAPPNFCAYRGDTITVKITGNHKKGSVSMTPKVAKDTWLSGSNAIDKGKFELYVNDDVANGEYKYIVNTQGGAVLDPRVTVKDH